MDIADLFKKTGFVISSELEDRFLVEYQRATFYVLKTEVEEYLRIKDIAIMDPKTSIFFPGYYEHLIEVQDRLGPYRLWTGHEESRDLSSHDHSLNLKISRISTTYLLHVGSPGSFVVNRTYGASAKEAIAL